MRNHASGEAAVAPLALLACHAQLHPCRRSISAIQACGMARGDDVRGLPLWCICKPRRFTNVGPGVFYEQPLLKFSGKTNKVSASARSRLIQGPGPNTPCCAGSS